MKELFKSYAKEENPNPRNEFHIYPLLTMLSHVTPSNTADYSLSVFHPYLIKIFLQSRCQKIRELSAVALITTTQEHEFITICQWLFEHLEYICTSNNAIDGCFLLLNLCLERHYGDIPEAIIGSLQQLFQGLFDGINIESLADIPFYYLLTSSKYLASDENLQKIADIGIDMLQNKKFGDEKCLSFSGLAELFVFQQDLWKDRKDKVPLKFRLECYQLANELDVEFLDQLYKDFGEVKRDEELMMVCFIFSEYVL
uniref:tRNA (32-2'-O)-methyltransferase regulator THADA-like C-terminal TPR repeats region domain-containing protein n=1 Tax=Panagrolaimus superbus TaxID=310955 RepID=A0A914YWJ8_9BILA